MNRERVSLLCAELAPARVAEGEGEGGEGGGHEVEVTIIRPGTSKNGLHYPAATLAAAVPLFEGAAAFADHPDAIDLTRQGGRSLRDLVGVYHDVRYENERAGEGGVRGRLRFLPSGEWAYRLVEAVVSERERGSAAPPVGISADLLVTRHRAGGGWVVDRVEAVNSADLVFRPAAGGSFDRLVEGEPLDRNAESEAGQGAREKEKDTLSTEVANTDPTAEVEAIREARQALCQDLLNARLAASTLPEAAQRHVRARFAGRLFAAADLETEIGATRDLLGAVVGGDVVRGMGAGRLGVKAGRTPLEKVNLALERLFGLPVPEDASDLPRLSGLREAYQLITGDEAITGRVDWERSVVREANEVTTSIMADALANVMNKRLVADYDAQPKWWRPLVTIADLRDMKAQTRVLLNDFAALATVNENAAYANLAWGDSKETYTPAKRGNLVYVTMETIVNDDLRAVQRIPRKLAAAATVTINEYMAALWTTGSGLGPSMADSYSVFDAGNHGNAGSSALDADALKAGITAMYKQANSAGKRIGARPRFLLIPPDLEWQAATLLNSTLLPGTPNNDANPLRGIVQPVVVPNWTDAENWYLHAAPEEVEGIELGFLYGRQQPELLVQDSPTAGSVFTNDAITWKVRWIFGAAWLDYRAGYGSVVSAG